MMIIYIRAAVISSEEDVFMMIPILCTTQHPAPSLRKNLTAKEMGDLILIISNTDGSLSIVNCQGRTFGIDHI